MQPPPAGAGDTGCPVLGVDITNLSLHSYPDITNQYGIFPTEPASSLWILLNQNSRQAPPVSRGQLKRKLISISKMVDLLPQACGHTKEAKMNMPEKSFHKYGYT